ncbi:TlpA disulfide reductase family protein [Sebaldella sp. S0638]|uniref:TlpA family protein disulfide reductase n=1 Tax=Sebaldella sp. S0638 TaxID=2957809 RepID=UPI00209E075E|nr:TlpA disulfide reductase family protein [Sebaldella sp. S0638]MCP1224680.1 TlpA family protein disulfide reductase [Sebaldella sp. S0638]
MKRFISLISVLILGVLLSVFAYSDNTPVSDTFSVDLQEGNTFPAFTLETLKGKKIISSKAFDKNKKTLIVTAAEWCPDCHEELPVLENFYRKNKNKYNFAVIFIERRSSEEKVKEYLEKEKFTFPVYYDYNSVFIDGTLINSVPTNIFLDKNGKITSVVVGTISDEKEFADALK